MLCLRYILLKKRNVLQLTQKALMYHIPSIQWDTCLADAPFVNCCTLIFSLENQQDRLWWVQYGYISPSGHPGLQSNSLRSVRLWRQGGSETGGTFRLNSHGSFSLWVLTGTNSPSGRTGRHVRPERHNFYEKTFAPLSSQSGTDCCLHSQN